MLQRNFDFMNGIPAQAETLKKELATRYEQFDADELKTSLLQKYSEMSKRNKVIVGFTVVGVTASVGATLAILARKRHQLENVFMGVTCTCDNCNECSCTDCVCSDCQCAGQEETAASCECDKETPSAVEEKPVAE